MVGDTNVPRGYKKNLQLALRVKNQRRQYRRLKQSMSSTITDDRIRSLEELEFVWYQKRANFNLYLLQKKYMENF